MNPWMQDAPVAPPPQPVAPPTQPATPPVTIQPAAPAKAMPKNQPVLGPLTEAGRAIETVTQAAMWKAQQQGTKGGGKGWTPPEPSTPPSAELLSKGTGKGNPVGPETWYSGMPAAAKAKATAAETYRAATSNHGSGGQYEGMPAAAKAKAMRNEEYRNARIAEERRAAASAPPVTVREKAAAAAERRFQVPAKATVAPALGPVTEAGTWSSPTTVVPAPGPVTGEHVEFSDGGSTCAWSSDRGRDGEPGRHHRFGG